MGNVSSQLLGAGNGLAVVNNSRLAFRSCPRVKADLCSALGATTITGTAQIA